MVVIATWQHESEKMWRIIIMDCKYMRISSEYYIEGVFDIYTVVYWMNLYKHLTYYFLT